MPQQPAFNPADAQGKLDLESEGIGKGARFTVLLPLLESHAVKEAQPEAAHA